VKRTSFGQLATIFAGLTAISYLLLHLFYGDLPTAHYYTALPILALAVVELVQARRVRAAVNHDPDAKLMTAIAIARLVALGRASALAGSALAGVLLALIVRVAPDAADVTAAGSDLRTGGVIFLSSILLLVAGLLLEAAGIDPQGRDGRSGHGPPVGNR
jgi:hypothetical protein